MQKNSNTDDGWATGDTGFLFEEYDFNDSGEKISETEDLVNQCVNLTSSKEEKLSKLREIRDKQVKSLKLIEKAIYLVEQEKK